jgi:hypothetical protein
MIAFFRTQGRTDSKPVLLRHLRADGTRIEDSAVPQPLTPPRSQDSSGRRGREDRSRRGDQGDRGTDRNRRGGRGSVNFSKQDKGTRVGQTSSPTLPATVADQMQTAPTANA